MADPVLAEDLRNLAEVVPFDPPTTKLLFDAAYALDAPEPGYQRIGDAIDRLLDAAELDLDLYPVGATTTTERDVDPSRRLAELLDKAGLIDWSALTEEDE